MRRAGLSLLLTATAVAVVVRGQQAPVFRTGVETVALYATVVDRYGELAKRLTRDDFEVFDNGKRQELSVFLSGQQPITAMVLIDTSQSMTFSLDLAKAAAEQFVIRLMPGDRARVGSFSDAIVISPEFTNNRDDLLHMIRENLHIGNPTRLWDAVDHSMTDMAGLGGRRVVVILTDGDDTYSRISARDVLERARTDEQMVYAVQFRTSALARMEVLPAQGPRAMLSGDTRRVPPGEILRQVASQTGGGYFFLRPNDDINTTFTRLADELHYQYVLGFSPQTLDGKVHQLDVKMKKTGLTVRTRKSYLAAKKPAQEGGRR